MESKARGTLSLVEPCLASLSTLWLPKILVWA